MLLFSRYTIYSGCKIRSSLFLSCFVTLQFLTTHFNAVLVLSVITSHSQLWTLIWGTNNSKQNGSAVWCLFTKFKQSARNCSKLHSLPYTPRSWPSHYHLTTHSWPLQRATSHLCHYLDTECHFYRVCNNPWSITILTADSSNYLMNFLALLHAASSEVSFGFRDLYVGGASSFRFWRVLAKYYYLLAVNIKLIW